MSITRKGGHAYLDGQEIADEVYATPEQHVVFGPATQEMLTLENAVLALVIFKLMKTPEGMKSLERITIKYLDSCARIVESVEQSCHSNWLTALDNQFITATIGHRIGLIDDGGYIRIMEHYRGVFDKMLVQKYVVEGLSTFVQTVQGSQTTMGEWSTKGIADIAALIKGLGQ